MIKGWVTERSIVHAWKACVPQGTRGSNPLPSALRITADDANFAGDTNPYDPDNLSRPSLTKADPRSDLFAITAGRVDLSSAILAALLRCIRAE